MSRTSGINAESARVALFGGSFNPPHVGHVLAVVYALSTQPIDRVLVVPVYQHPFAKELAPFEDRLEMCRLALGWVPGVDVSALERELGGESRTLRTVEELARRNPGWTLRLLIGADVLTEAPKWHRFDRIAELAPPIVLGRVGATAEGATPPMLPAISSTDIREAIAQGRTAAIRDWLPRGVMELIVERGLYRSG